MLGSIVNAAAVFIGGFIGLVFRKGIPERFNNTVIHGVGLAVILIGLMGAMEVSNILLLIISLLIGGIIGELIGIEAGLENFGKKLEMKFSKDGNDIAKGFVTTTLMFCVGSMSIIGALEGGLTGEHTTLFAKSVIDFFVSIVFASTMGIGVIFSGFSVLFYEGSIAALAFTLKDVLVGEVITDMSAVGGLLIAALGFKMVFGADIKVGNLLPAMIIPVIYYTVMNLF
ncbi:MAG: DUF554 domain-containing protein [Clostridiales bacterium]|nr:DUF554 domain-containing protein [Clostridiales bacterium]